MKKNIKIYLMFVIGLLSGLLLSEVRADITIESLVSNAVQVIRKILVQDDNGSNKIVIDGQNGDITMSGALNIQVGALKDGTIVSADVKDNSLTASDLAANSVGASELANNAVDNGAIQDNAVTSNKIKDYEVKSSDINTGAVINSKIANGAVDYSKMNVDGCLFMCVDSNNTLTDITIQSCSDTYNCNGTTYKMWGIKWEKK